MFGRKRKRELTDEEILEFMGECRFAMERLSEKVFELQFRVQDMERKAFFLDRDF